MNLFKILANVGGSIITDVIPGGKEIVKVINEFLPSDKKINDKATGTEIESAIASLSPEDQTTIYLKEFDVEITAIQEHTKVISALGEIDKTGSSTRPAIAMMMAHVVCFAVILLITAIFISIYSEDNDTLLAISDSWPLVLAILATPTALLRAYFGMRTKEKQQKYSAISNAQPQSSIINMIKAIKGGK